MARTASIFAISTGLTLATTLTIPALAARSLVRTIGQDNFIWRRRPVRGVISGLRGLSITELRLHLHALLTRRTLTLTRRKFNIERCLFSTLL